MAEIEQPPPETPKKKPSHLWKPGQSGNPAGRKLGARNKLGEKFIDDVYQKWCDKGAQVLEQMVLRHPEKFCKLVADILPTQVVQTAFNLNATVDMNKMVEQEGYLAAYRFARDAIGAPIPGETPLIELSPEAEIAWRADE
jgi:hypothetical protein